MKMLACFSSGVNKACVLMNRAFAHWFSISEWRGEENIVLYSSVELLCPAHVSSWTSAHRRSTLAWSDNEADILVYKAREAFCVISGNNN